VPLRVAETVGAAEVVRLSDPAVTVAVAVAVAAEEGAALVAAQIAARLTTTPRRRAVGSERFIKTVL
jgi:hypothetical protein